jgi:hypothetical protein
LAAITGLEEIYILGNAFTVSLDADFCGVTQQFYDDLEADCKEPNPEIECTCCTMCCNAEGEDCEAPSPPPTDAPLGPNITAAEATERYNTLVETLTPISGLDALQDETTAQYTAAMWLAGSDPAILDLATVEFDQLVQRYLMALLYYSTKGDEWTSQLGFLTADTVCDWNARSGVECNTVGLIDVLDLGTYDRPSNYYFLVRSWPVSKLLTH